MKRAAALLTLALAACGTSGKPSASPSPTVPTESPTPSPSEAESATATPSVVPSATALPTDLKDGKTYVYATSIDTAKYTIVVDVVQFLTGEEARKAAEADGKEADNDYYIRNQNTRLRTLSFVATMPIVVNTLTAEETGDSTKDTTITPTRFDAYFAEGEAQARIYWFVLADGVVTQIHEQYVP